MLEVVTVVELDELELSSVLDDDDDDVEEEDVLEGVAAVVVLSCV